MIKALLFDWGNTVMVDFNLPGPMYEWTEVAWVAGAEKSLAELSVKFPCYIATNAGMSDGKAVLKGLKRAGADKYFSGIFCSADIGFEKPDQNFFREIIRKLEYLPGELVMIGDNYLKDIEGAKRSGIRTVFFDRTGTDGRYPMADSVIYSMNELTSAITKL